VDIENAAPHTPFPDPNFAACNRNILMACIWRIAECHALPTSRFGFASTFSLTRRKII
jgi:hypothetical protein